MTGIDGQAFAPDGNRVAVDRAAAKVVACDAFG